MLRALRGPGVFDARWRRRGARETRCATTARRGLVSAWRPWFHHAGSFACSRCPSCRARRIAPVWLRRAARRSDFVESLLMTLSRDAPPTWWMTLRRSLVAMISAMCRRELRPRGRCTRVVTPICVRARSCCREARGTASRPDSSMAAGEPHDHAPTEVRAVDRAPVLGRLGLLGARWSTGQACRAIAEGHAAGTVSVIGTYTSSSSRSPRSFAAE